MALNINGTTGIAGVDGSASAPAVTGTDSNTGITFPSADTIKFATGGVERMSITKSGVSGITAGITEADSWRVNSDFSAGTGTNIINTNWERDDTDFEKIGTGLSHDGSGKFGFQVTGKYLLTFFYSGAVLSGNDARYAGIRVYVATDGISGTYNERAKSLDSVNGLSSSSTYAAGSVQKILDVTNTNTYFYIATYTTGSITWRLDGTTNQNQNGFISIRLGDT